MEIAKPDMFVPVPTWTITAVYQELANAAYITSTGDDFAQSPQSFAEYTVGGVGKSFSFSTAKLATVLHENLWGFSV